MTCAYLRHIRAARAGIRAFAGMTVETLENSMEKTFNVINFGCRATQADGAAIEQALQDFHLLRSEEWRRSDVVVINTCTVTNTADVEARQMIRRVHRENPTAKIVVTGCYAQRAPEEIARIEGV